MTAALATRLAHRRALGNYRALPTQSALVDFSSNDYLGLARTAALSTAVLQEATTRSARWGSTGSRLLTGNSAYTEEVETLVAQFHGYAAATLFNCGYMANVGLLSTVATQDDYVFFDAQVHASTQEGIRLSRARAFPFRHNALEHLEKRLKHAPCAANRFICIESLYSTDGSVAPLPQMCALAEKYGAHLIVDEAHAVGVCGPEGRGLVAAHALQQHVFAQVVTGGKALGACGAFVLGSALLKEALINFATAFIYTTALPFYAVAALKCAYALLPQLAAERAHIQTLSTLFRGAGYTGTHIQSIPCLGNAAARQCAAQCAQAGFDVRPLLSPTVQRGKEVVRVCLHAHNTLDEAHRLLDLLSTCKSGIFDA